MAHHKKRRGPNARGHCKLCKYWKIEGFSKERKDAQRFSDYKRRYFSNKEIEKHKNENLLG